MKINIEDLTLGQIRQLQAALTNERPEFHPYPVGQNVIIRTVTMFYTGRLAEVHEHELVLEEAAWIADTGRWADALSNAALSEVEPFPAGRVIVGRGALIDCAIWKHALPKEQK